MSSSDSDAGPSLSAGDDLFDPAYSEDASRSRRCSGSACGKRTSWSSAELVKVATQHAMLGNKARVDWIASGSVACGAFGSNRTMQLLP